MTPEEAIKRFVAGEFASFLHVEPVKEITVRDVPPFWCTRAWYVNEDGGLSALTVRSEIRR